MQRLRRKKKTKIRRSEAEEVFKRLEGFFHHVWRDSDGKLYERTGKRPWFFEETIAWLPRRIFFFPDDPNREPETEPIIDPVTFDDWVYILNWEIIDED